MVNLFISYRRSDSQDFAGRLHDHLIRAFDASEVFIDVDNIAAGEDFVEVLEDQLDKTDVMLVVIGTSWLTASDGTGRRRLDHPQDYVRQEIAKALEREIEVIPVLTGTANMPQVTDLPDVLTSLANKNAVWLRHNSFASDVKRLAKAIKQQTQRSKKNDWSKFGQSIADEYNKHFILNSIREDHRLQLYFGSESSIESPFQSHLLKDAIVSLIDGADLGLWVKEKKELQPEDFWAAILKAVAASYRFEIPHETDIYSDYDLIRQLLTELEAMGLNS